MNNWWQEIVKKAVSKFETPFFISAWRPVCSALEELKILEVDLPIRHWLSFKTHPVAPLLREWRKLGYGVEVVSEYEFLAALKEGFEPRRILVNGVAKHTWLSRHQVKGILVHFDSLREIEKLSHRATEFKWNVGIRCHVAEEYDPDEPNFGGQFGMLEDEVVQAISELNKAGIKVESIHFHLRTNVSSADSYKCSIEELASVCKKADLRPFYVDCGGGLPVKGERPLDPQRSSPEFDLSKLCEIFKNIPSLFPTVREIWLENGRFITARSGVLVIRVVDIKQRSDSRYLLCDGGRTNHALVSDWEVHEFFSLPQRAGPCCLTTVCGPTYMAFDRLFRAELPRSIEIGDYIIWMNAGAYHIPWETRFSHGFAKVLWYDNQGRLSIAREREQFSQWWGHWL